MTCLVEGMTVKTAGGSVLRELRSVLEGDHRAIHAALTRMLQALKDGDRDARESAWLELDERLRTHMTLEEEHLFRELAEIDPREAHALAGEHCRIRALLGELDIDLELSLGGEATLSELGRVLRDHVAREHALLYRWCDESLSDEARDVLRARLASTLSRLGCDHDHTPQTH